MLPEEQHLAEALSAHLDGLLHEVVRADAEAQALQRNAWLGLLAEAGESAGEAGKGSPEYLRWQMLSAGERQEELALTDLTVDFVLQPRGWWGRLWQRVSNRRLTNGLRSYRIGSLDGKLPPGAVRVSLSLSRDEGGRYRSSIGTEPPLASVEGGML